MISHDLEDSHTKHYFRVFSAANQALHARILGEMIARDRNHPSVIMWSISNEPQTSQDASRDYYA